MDYDKFVELLKKAIGDRSQTKFAKDAGIAVETLNRMLNMKSGQPSKKTLSKIAAASDGAVTQEELLHVSGYIVSKYSVEEVQDKMQKFIMDFPFKRDEVYTSLQQFIQNKTSMFEAQKQIPITYIIQKEKPVQPQDQEGEFAVLVSFSSELPNQNIVLVADIVVFYFKTVTEKCIIRKISYEPEITQRYGSQIASRLIQLQKHEETRNLYVLRTKKKYAEESAEQKLLNIIFGNQHTETERISGIGFCVYHNLPEYVFKEFLLKHRDSFCQTEQERQILSEYVQEGSLSRTEAFCHYKAVTPSGAGGNCWLAAITNIIYRETNGLSIQGWRNVGYCGDKPCADCILLPKMFPWEASETDRTYSMTQLLATLDKYAKDLRTEVGEFEFTVDIPTNR